MKLRPYQQQAVDNTLEAFQKQNSALCVMATGLGKTVFFSHVAKRFVQHGRVLILAHREELIWQAADKIKKVTGIEPGIEMAEWRAAKAGIWGQDKIIVSSVQTQVAGNEGNGRMALFDPAEFALVIIDEAHHAPAASYRRILAHYLKNPKLKVLGVTATPDRTDEEALGQIFETCAFEYDIIDGINDGYLVPVEARMVAVSGLDLSTVRTTGGDLNGADLARVMEYETTLHEIASPTMELTKGRKTLVFAASVSHAERLAEIFNRYEPNCANWVCGETNKDDRKRMFADFAQKKFRILVNVGVATEGFDDPGIEVIVMARPTKSRALYAQMLGRGTRPLPGVVDGIARVNEDDSPLFNMEETEAARMRRDAIAASGKPSVECIDFVGNAGRHKLITPADVLGGKHSEEAIELAANKAAADGGKKNVLQAIEEAEEEIHKEREEAARSAAAERAKIKIKANYQTDTIDAFNIFGIAQWQERGWNKGRPAGEKQIALLEKFGVKEPEKLNFTQASQLVTEFLGRREKGLCTYKQARILKRYGYSTDVSFDQAKATIDKIAANGWQRPSGEQIAAAAGIERF